MRSVPRIYVGGPYSHPDRCGRELNAARAVRVAENVMLAGGHPVVPHVIGLALEHVSDDYGYWMAVTSDELRTCRGMIVVCGWQSSRGTTAEVEQCAHEGRPWYIANMHGELPADAIEMIAYWRGSSGRS